MMAPKHAFQLVTVVVLMAFVKADYECLCSYEVEAKIYDAPSDKENIIGFMYEFDCKPTLNVANTDKRYQPIGHEHQVCLPIFSLKSKRFSFS